MKALPHERFMYLGDTARLPYGTKSPQTVARYALQAAEALVARRQMPGGGLQHRRRVGLDAVRARFGDLPVIGVIEPGAQAACAKRSGHIAVIATEATVRGGAYQHAILERRADARVQQLATQLLVALAEEGLVEGPVAEGVVRYYLDPLFATGPAGHAGAGMHAFSGACTDHSGCGGSEGRYRGLRADHRGGRA